MTPRIRMLHILTCISLLLCVGVPCQQVIAEITNAESLHVVSKKIQALGYPAKHILVIFDVDDVITAPKDHILRVKHRKTSGPLIDAIVEKRSKEIENGDKETLFWEIITDFARQCERQLVDEAILTLISQLKKERIRTIALTNCKTGKLGRIDNMEEWRLADLRSCGVDFSSSFDIPEKIKLGSPVSPQCGPPLYLSGAVFTSGHDKGTTLGTFLKKVEYIPKCIVFIDNKAKHLLSVEEYCNIEGIEYHGFLYTAAENQNLGPLNYERARLQFEHLESKGVWLSDAEADELLKNKAF